MQEATHDPGDTSIIKLNQITKFHIDFHKYSMLLPDFIFTHTCRCDVSQNFHIKKYYLPLKWNILNFSQVSSG